MKLDTTLYVYHYVMPAAFGLLPARMESKAARAMLLAIGLQESRFEHRIQVPNGPAHGFWQFERMGGIHGVLTHPVTGPLLSPVLGTLNYPATARECYAAVIHNDVLACVFARLLLWTVPGVLPTVAQPVKAWQQYLEGWRPGKPHRETWDECFAEGWRVVMEEGSQV